VDAGFIAKPAGRTPQPNGTRSDGTPLRDSIPASLSAAQSVTAAAKSAEARAEDNFHVRKIVLDAQSREVIHQALDTARRLVRQVPEETRQRLRAYVRGRAAVRREKSKDGLDLEV
jgi:hypothetical protein